MSIRSSISERAVRSYRRLPVPVDSIRRIVDNARWTSSARNRQPWRFIAVYDQDVRAELATLGAYAAHAAAAPVVLVLLSPVNRYRDTDFDMGRVAQSITLLAAEEGLVA